MITIKLILKLINILNKDASPRQIAGGMALGAIAGLTPTASLHNVVVLVLVLMLKVNVTSAVFAWGLFSLFAYALDPLFNQVGYSLLTGVPALTPLWTALYNTPIVPWTRFNNTLVLGSLVCALAAFWPLYFLLAWAVAKYREKVLVWVNKLKIVQVLKASKLFALYRSYS